MNIGRILEILAYLSFAMALLGVGLMASVSFLLIGWAIGLGLYNAIVFAIAGGTLSSGLISRRLYNELVSPFKQPTPAIQV